ncbi:uncharacterized, partial [Tachysurus ichikawai]
AGCGAAVSERCGVAAHHQSDTVLRSAVAPSMSIRSAETRAAVKPRRSVTQSHTEILCHLNGALLGMGCF